MTQTCYPIGRAGLMALALALADALGGQPGGFTTPADRRLAEALGTWLAAEATGGTPPAIAQRAAELLEGLTPTTIEVVYTFPDGHEEPGPTFPVPR